MTDWHPDPTWIRDRRVQYETDGLDVGDLDADPMAQWQRWHDEALTAGVAEPNAMVVSSVDGDGRPDSRVLLVRGADVHGFTVFTNYQSAKSHQFEHHHGVAGVFAWLDLHRQVRVRGSIARIDDAESDAYFASRPRGSQIGAWASPQSTVIGGRTELEARVADAERRFHGVDVPRPVHWGGWRIQPDSFEFWQGRPNRLHDRLRYRFESGAWVIERLAP